MEGQRAAPRRRRPVAVVRHPSADAFSAARLPRPVASCRRPVPRHPIPRERTSALGISSTKAPEFAVTRTDGTVIATFTIAADGQVTCDNEMVTDMVTSMINARHWTAEQATTAFSEGWSNGYLSIN